MEELEDQPASRRDFLRGFAGSLMVAMWAGQKGCEEASEEAIECYENMTVEEQVEMLEIAMYYMESRISNLEKWANDVQTPEGMPEPQGET